MKTHRQQKETRGKKEPKTQPPVWRHPKGQVTKKDGERKNIRATRTTDRSFPEKTPKRKRVPKKNQREKKSWVGETRGAKANNSPSKRAEKRRIEGRPSLGYS